MLNFKASQFHLAQTISQMPASCLSFSVLHRHPYLPISNFYAELCHDDLNILKAVMQTDETAKKKKKKFTCIEKAEGKTFNWKKNDIYMSPWKE